MRPSKDVSKIHLEIPNDYRGAFIITEDEADGDALLHGHSYSIVIPSTGRCSLRSCAMFFRWHELTAAYEDGRDLTRYRLGANAVDPKEAQCWQLWSENNSTIWFFVGTNDEYLRAKNGHPPLPIGGQEE